MERQLLVKVYHSISSGFLNQDRYTNHIKYLISPYFDKTIDLHSHTRPNQSRSDNHFSLSYNLFQIPLYFVYIFDP